MLSSLCLFPKVKVILWIQVLRRASDFSSMILNYMKKFWMGGWEKLFILTKCCLVSCLEGRQWVLYLFWGDWQESLGLKARGCFMYLVTWKKLLIEYFRKRFTRLWEERVPQSTWFMVPCQYTVNAKLLYP